MSPSTIVTKKAVVNGNVQGVGFRNAVFHESKKIGGLKGWIFNKPDGTVEVVVQGPQSKVDALFAACRKVPPPARVDSVEIEDFSTTKSLPDFGIRKL